MNEELLLDAIGEIDEDIIAEADEIRQMPLPKNTSSVTSKTRVLATAACLVAIISLTLVTAKFIHDSGKLISGGNDENKAAPELKASEAAGKAHTVGTSSEVFIPYDNEVNKAIPEELPEFIVDAGDVSEETIGAVTDAVPETAPGAGTAQTEIVPSGSASPETEAPDASAEPPKPITLYGGTPLPDDPSPIKRISLRYENGGYTGENLDYTDNATLRLTDKGVIFALCFYQDSLDYTADMTNTLRRCVTVDYDGIGYDNLDYANDSIAVTLNGSPATLTEVSLGMGNGHVDYYFTAVYTDGSKPNALDSFTFEVNADKHADNISDVTGMPSENPPSEIAEPMILPKFVPDGTDYFNYGHRTYTLWQKVTNVNDGIALFEVTDTKKTNPDEPYIEYGGTVTSGVYPIAGFNTDFALAAMLDGEYYAFVCLNDINLTAPEDLLFTLFRLDEKFVLTGVRAPNKAEPDTVADSMRASKEYSDFLDALHTSRFAEPVKLLRTLVAELYFTCDNGMTLTLELSKLDGEYFVNISNANDADNILIKSDSDAFKAFASMIK